MLKALYDYANRKHLLLPPGYVNKTLKAYISLSLSGEFLGFYMADNTKPIPCPDIGSLANGTDKCNALAEKRSVILPEKESAKNKFFMETLEAASEAEPMLSICLAALNDAATAAAIRKGADDNRIKPEDRLSFMVDGESILDSPAITAWWRKYRLRFTENANAQESLCIITGEPTIPMRTTPPVSGLKPVGGHARGDALICFDKGAFCSYGLTQAANAPVSEEAYAAVKAALDDLIAKAPIMAGMKFLHWYDCDIPVSDDPLLGVLAGLSAETDEDAPIGTKHAGQNDAIGAESNADRLIRSVTSGEKAPPLASEYYILMLSGVNGRVMIRRWEYGHFEELQRNINKWYDDISLVDLAGTGTVKPYTLTARMIRLLKKQKVDSNVFERLKNELPGITPAVINSIIAGAPLPDAVAVRSLAYIRSQMMESDDEQKVPNVPDSICCQWLKVWLLRKSKEEGLMVKYNPEHAAPAYHCGAIMAVYAAIQSKAMPDVNASIVQRYYGAAIQTPAFVISRLSVLSTHHMEKIESKWFVNTSKELLNASYCGIGDTIPLVLNLEQQAYFALGYRHMASEINLRVNERNAELNEKRAAKSELTNQKEECE